MGGGVSAIQFEGLENAETGGSSMFFVSSTSDSMLDELRSTALMIGRAIAAMSFPGMYRIYDFHSQKAPKLKNLTKFSFSFFDDDNEDDEDDNDELNQPNHIDPSEYENLFHVQVGEDIIYLDDPLQENEAGWTPLHTCCLSMLTLEAGLLLVDEVKRRGGSLDIPTKHGPGSFNKGWTPLSMASAYGLDKLVDKLVEEGADVNTTNSFGLTPLLEACHRGYANIVTSLIKGNADLNYIPSDSVAFQSPFIGSPPHTALGEACRAGFHFIAQQLIKAGADINLANNLGWTPLHEACFYNRIDAVRVLLANGADPTIRTHKSTNALPFHFAGYQILKDMLQETNISGALPIDERDIVDMISVIKELTMQSHHDSDNNQDMPFYQSDSDPTPTTTQLESPRSPQRIERTFSQDDEILSAPRKPRSNFSSPVIRNDEKDEKLSSLLGDLPSLSKSNEQNKFGNELESALRKEELKKMHILKQSNVNDPEKIKSKKSKKKKQDIPPDMPEKYICQLTQRPMSDPYKSRYGNVFEYSAIMKWFQQQGHICPLTGAPLSEHDLKPQGDLADEIKQWILSKSTSIKPKLDTKADAKTSNDELYDF